MPLDVVYRKNFGATLFRWLVNVGDPVTKGQFIYEQQYPDTRRIKPRTSPHSGFVLELCAARGTLLVDQLLLARIGTADELRARGIPVRAAPSSPVAIAQPLTGARVAEESGPTATSRLFICYRREDTQDAAGRLHDRLVAVYGPERVFMDIDSVPLGVNFVTYIAKALKQCAAVLVLIGRNWSAIRDEAGDRRLDDPADHVRVEIAAALRQDVLVIPLLVQNALMPRASDLPDELKQLASYNALKLAPEFWREGVERLIKDLDKVMKG